MFWVLVLLCCSSSEVGIWFGGVYGISSKCHRPVTTLRPGDRPAELEPMAPAVFWVGWNSIRTPVIAYSSQFLYSLRNWDPGASNPRTSALFPISPGYYHMTQKAACPSASSCGPRGGMRRLWVCLHVILMPRLLPIRGLSMRCLRCLPCLLR